jgi:hypothetical protein
MSMWLTLTRVGPEVSAAPDPAAGGTDEVGYELGVVTELAEARAGGEPGSFWTQRTWLARAAGIGADTLAADGAQAPAWRLTPGAVDEIARGLAAEAAATEAGPYANLLRAFADFYAEAAAERQAVIGRLS